MKLRSVRGWYGPAIVVVVLTIVGVVAGIVGSQLNSGIGRFSPRDYGPHGMAALARLWERLGHDVQAVSVSDVVPIHGDDKALSLGGTFVFTDTPHLRFSRSELRRWIEAGNTVIVLGRSHDGLNVHSDRWLDLRWGYLAEEFNGSAGLPREWFAQGLRDLDDLELRSPVRGVETTTNFASELSDVSTDPDGPNPLYLQRHVAVAQIGDGWIVAIADPRTLSNRDIHRSDHATLAAHLTQYFLPDRPVYMVDVSPPSTPQPIIVGDRLPISPETLWYAMFISCLVLWRVGRRFGSPVTLDATSHRRLMEQVISVANLYQRGKAHRRGLRAVYESAQDQVLRQLGDAQPFGDPPLARGRQRSAIDWERAQRLMASRIDNASPVGWAALADRTEQLLAGAKASAREIVELARQWEAVRRAAGGKVIPTRMQADAYWINEVEE